MKVVAHLRSFAVLAATLPTLIIATPADALPSHGIILEKFPLVPLQGFANCPSGYICMYRDINFGGGGYGVREGRDLNDFRGIDFNDQMTSWVNATNSNYCWYPDINWSGPVRFMLRGTSANVDLNRDNDIASSLENC
ncbi:peptidase inhibitor family I36 protein [Streptomyces sp. 1222.5]|uniref:peptidase inhibitor family I36 protein n=1 Tax=Streptomyces sp. 1222.5 TaxID=1881026 RepID=UPI003EB96BED